MCKKYHISKKDYSWNPSTFICENSRYSKSIADDSSIACDKIVSNTNSVSTNVTNTISTNVMSTVLINFGYKKVRYKMVAIFCTGFY